MPAALKLLKQCRDTGGMSALQSESSVTFLGQIIFSTPIEVLGTNPVTAMPPM